MFLLKVQDDGSRRMFVLKVQDDGSALVVMDIISILEARHFEAGDLFSPFIISNVTASNRSPFSAM